MAADSDECVLLPSAEHEAKWSSSLESSPSQSIGRRPRRVVCQRRHALQLVTPCRLPFSSMRHSAPLHISPKRLRTSFMVGRKRAPLVVSGKRGHQCKLTCRMTVDSLFECTVQLLRRRRTTGANMFDASQSRLRRVRTGGTPMPMHAFPATDGQSPLAVTFSLW